MLAAHFWLNVRQDKKKLFQTLSTVNLCVNSHEFVTESVRAMTNRRAQILPKFYGL